MAGKIRHLIRNLRHPRKLSNIFRMKMSQKKERDIPCYLPMVLDIEPNVKCNLSCRMCQVATWDRMVPDLTSDRFREILESVPTLMKIKLQGMGEPFLNRDLLEMAGLAARHGIKVVTNSNGTLLDEEAAVRVMASRLDTLSISVDGATRDTYESIRIGAKFENVMENIKRLIRIRGKAVKPEIEIWMVGMRMNIGELPEMVRLCSDLGVDRLNFQHDVNFWGKEEWVEKLSEDSLRLDDPEVNEIIERARSLAVEFNLEFNVFTGDRYSRKKGIDCRWPWESVYITTEGYVCPCCIACDPGVVNFGNIFEEGFESIWKGPRYAAFRKRIREGDLPGFCRACYID